MEPIDEPQEIPARNRIEPRHGLVEHQHLGLHGEHAGKRHAALLAARKLKGVLVAYRGKLDQLHAKMGSLGEAQTQLKDKVSAAKSACWR